MINLIAPDQYNFAKEVERFVGDEKKIAIKFVTEEDSITDINYRDLVTSMNQYANALVKQGVKQGERALLIIPKVPEAYSLYLACLKAGIVIIPCSEMLRAKDLAYRIQHAEATTVIVYHHLTITTEIDHITDPLPTLAHKFTVGESERDGWVSLTAIAKNESEFFIGAPTKREDIALLPYTSGTTGNPKGVVHNHGWFYTHLQIAPKLWLDVKENDLVWATAAPGWQKWIWSPFISTVGMGATAFVYNGRFDAKRYLQLLEEHGINVLCCTPTEYRFMAKLEDLSRYQLPQLRSAVSAGEPLNVQVIETFERQFNVLVRDGYGQTENTLLIGTMPGMKPKFGSMGKPVPGYKVDIINEEGEPCLPGEVGDIAVHKTTPVLFQEYFKDENRTVRAYRGDWYLTGDQAKKDEEGYFWYEGRSDDIIISSGYTIGPFEVEDALTKHPLVRECAVVASPDPDRGHVVKAFVVLRDELTEDTDTLIEQLQEHVKLLTAPYKYPRKIEFVEELPKTTSGKIRRIELRNKEQQTVR